MSITITGTVTNGVVIPSSPLPEGMRVEIRPQSKAEIPPDLQVELDDWERVGAGSIEIVERLADEIEANEKR